MGLVSLFSVSAVTVGFEIVLSIILGLVLPAPDVPVAIALALAGIAGGGLIGQLVEPRDTRTALAWASLFMAGALAVSTACLLGSQFVPTIPLGTPPEGTSYAGTWSKLTFVLPLLGLPFLAGGFLQSKLLMGPRFGLRYGVDLLGATVGAVAFPRLLRPFGLAGTITSLAIAAALPALLEISSRKKGRALLVALAAATISLVAVLAPEFRVKYEARTGGFGSTRVGESWTATTRVSHWKGAGDSEFYVSGAGSFSVYKPAPWPQAATFSWTAPLEARPGADVLVVAAGAGSEVAAASALGARSIDAVEISSALVREMKEARAGDPGNPYRLPGVTLFESDARTFLARSRGKYDLILLKSFDSVSELAWLSGAIATNYVHTRDAVSEYLRALRPGGYFSFTTRETPNDPRRRQDGPFTEGIALGWGDLAYARFLAIVAGLKSFGAADPAAHLFIYSSDDGHAAPFLTFVTSRDPLTEIEITNLVSLLRRRRADHAEVLYPRGPASSAIASAIARVNADQPVEPFQIATDDRPFPFGSGVMSARTTVERALGTRFRAGFLVMGLLLALVVGIPLRLSRRSRKQGMPLRLTWTMILTGVGFIAIEIAGLARFEIFLGSPSLAVITVVAAMILGAGLGSLHSERLEPSRKSLSGVAIAGAFSIGAWFGFAAVFHSFLMALPPVATLAVVALGFVAVGFLLGHVVPLAIRTYSPQSGAFAWAITASASTMGALATDAWSRDFGFTSAAVLALACYALVALLGVAGKRRPKQQRTA